MLHILLMLLKIIGIILLLILGILVLFVCVALFVPLRYRGEAKGAGDLDSIRAYLKFSWFLHLVSGHVSYENKKLVWQVRVLWKKVNVREEKEHTGNSKSIKKSEKKYKVKEVEESAKVEAVEDTIIDNVEELEQMTTEEDTSNNGKKTKKQSFLEKIKYTIRNICDKIKLLIEKREKLEAFITNEIHRASWNRMVQEMVRFVKYIRPKKLVLNLHFGFEDPALTGKVLGGISMLYPFYAKHMNITPDFEQKVLEGDAFIKGTVRGMHALIIVWNLIFDKNIKTTYKEIQKWKG